MLELLTAEHTFVNEALARHYGMNDVRGTRFRRVELDGCRTASACSAKAACCSCRRIRIARRRCCAANGCSRTCSARRRRRRRRTSKRSSRPSKGRRRARCARGSRRIARIRRAMRATASSIRSASRSRTSTPSAAGASWIARPATPIDASGVLVDGTADHGPRRAARRRCSQRPDQFVQTLTEKLMTYGLGRSLEHTDMPTVRRIVRDAAENDYRFSDLVWGIVE